MLMRSNKLLSHFNRVLAALKFDANFVAMHSN